MKSKQSSEVILDGFSITESKNVKQCYFTFLSIFEKAKNKQFNDSTNEKNKKATGNDKDFNNAENNYKAKFLALKKETLEQSIEQENIPDFCYSKIEEQEDSAELKFIFKSKEVFNDESIMFCKYRKVE